MAITPCTDPVAAGSDGVEAPDSPAVALTFFCPRPARIDHTPKTEDLLRPHRIHSPLSSRRCRSERQPALARLQNSLDPSGHLSHTGLSLEPGQTVDCCVAIRAEIPLTPAAEAVDELNFVFLDEVAVHAHKSCVPQPLLTSPPQSAPCPAPHPAYPNAHIN